MSYAEAVRAKFKDTTEEKIHGEGFVTAKIVVKI